MVGLGLDTVWQGVTTYEFIVRESRRQKEWEQKSAAHREAVAIQAMEEKQVRERDRNVERGGFGGHGGLGMEGSCHSQAVTLSACTCVCVGGRVCVDVTLSPLLERDAKPCPVSSLSP